MTYPPGLYPPYSQQERLQNVRTPWTDIDNERAGMTSDEVAFVMNDPEYCEAEQAVRSSFYQFLERSFRDEFLKTDSQGLVEKKLLALKVARSQFHKQNDGILDDPEVKALIDQKRREKCGNRS